MINIFVMPENSDAFFLPEDGKEFYFDEDGNRNYNLDFPNVEKWRRTCIDYGDDIALPYYFLTSSTQYESMNDFYDEFPEFLL